MQKPEGPNTAIWQPCVPLHHDVQSEDVADRDVEAAQDPPSHGRRGGRPRQVLSPQVVDELAAVVEHFVREGEPAELNLPLGEELHGVAGSDEEY